MKKALVLIILFPSIVLAQLNGEKEYSLEDVVLYSSSLLTDKMGRPITGYIKQYDGDTLYSIMRFKDGQLNGVTEMFYPDGSIQYEIPYTMNQINGVLKEYYKDGKLFSEFPYKNNLVNGLYKEYNENGTVIREVNFVDGVMNGIEKRFKDGGLLYMEIEYKNDSAVKGCCIKGKRKTWFTAKQLEELNEGFVPECP